MWSRTLTQSSCLWHCKWNASSLLRNCQVVPGRHGPLRFQMMRLHRPQWVTLRCPSISSPACHRALTGMPPFTVAMKEGCYGLWRLHVDDDDDNGDDADDDDDDDDGDGGGGGSGSSSHSMRPSSNNGSNLIVLTMLNASIVRAQRNRNLANLYDSRLFRLFKLVKFFLVCIYCILLPFYGE